MPPLRRKSALATQQTLAFGPRSKVTKPSLPPSSKKASKRSSNPPPLAQVALDGFSTPSPAPTLPSEEDTEAEESQHSKNDDAEDALLPKSPGGRLVIREVQPERTELEKQAMRLGDGELRRYWLGTEAERKAKPVHQGGLSMDEKILRHFDLSSQYGPCIGIERMKRWKRAHTLGLKPPTEVLAVLLKSEGKGGKKAQWAYIDELLSTRIGSD